MQGRYYELGAEVTRAEESIRYTRELRDRARRPGAGQCRLESTGQQIAHDEEQLASRARRDRTAGTRSVSGAQQAEALAAAALAEAERELQDWQQRWEVQSRRRSAPPTDVPRSSAPASSTWRISGTG